MIEGFFSQLLSVAQLFSSRDKNYLFTSILGLRATATAAAAPSCCHIRKVHACSLAVILAK